MVNRRPTDDGFVFAEAPPRRLLIDLVSTATRHSERQLTPRNRLYSAKARSASLVLIVSRANSACGKAELGNTIYRTSWSTLEFRVRKQKPRLSRWEHGSGHPFCCNASCTRIDASPILLKGPRSAQ